MDIVVLVYNLKADNFWPRSRVCRQLDKHQLYLKDCSSVPRDDLHLNDLKEFEAE